MTDTRPGPDELRVRGILRDRGVGPDAQPGPPAVPPALPDGYEAAPAKDPDAWWDDLYADEQPKPAGHAPAPRPAPDEAHAEDPADEVGTDLKPDKATVPHKRHRLRKAKPAPAKTTRKAAEHPAVTDPRKSLLDAIDGVPHRIRRLISNVTAAGLGWSLGWVDFAEDVCAWVHTHGPTDAQSIFWFCVGYGCLAFARRGRACWWPVAWLASVPAASAIAGVLLYAPTA